MMDKLKAFMNSLKAEKVLKGETSNSGKGLKSKERAVYKKDFYPLRKIYIWGWDENNSPACLILYGYQEFQTKSSRHHKLKPDVDYRYYLICRGEEGHFPSFKSEKAELSYDHRTKTRTSTMYFKKNNKKEGVAEFQTFTSSEKIRFPYPNTMSQAEYVRELKAKKIDFDNFVMADSLGDVLPLNPVLEYYSESLYPLFCDPNLYRRKKALKDLISQNPAPDLYRFLLRAGSGELISGLFMEFAAQKNNLLEKEAGNYADGGFHWLRGREKEGVMRCARIYLNMLDDKVREERIRFIEENLEDMDLTLIVTDDHIIPRDRKLEGRDYKKCADRGYLAQHTFRYDFKSGTSVPIRRSCLYKRTYYCDGGGLNINRFKNTIQEAELYGLSEAAGRIAYFTDAPRLESHFRGNSNMKALKYFRRYLRRILERYGEEDEEKYVKAVKVLMTSYKKEDYSGSYPGNFQKNYFIKQFLYHGYRPAGGEGRERLGSDRHLKLDGRYEYRGEIWDRHLTEAADIAIGSEVEAIIKAFYYILKDAEKEKLINLLSTNQLTELAGSSFKPMSELFTGILKEKLEQEDVCDVKLLMLLLDSKNQVLQDAGIEYFNRTQGIASAEEAVALLSLKHLEKWKELVKYVFRHLEGSEIHAFISILLYDSSNFSESTYFCKEALEEILEEFSGWIQDKNVILKGELAGLCISELYKPNIPAIILSFMESVIFMLPLKPLENLLEYHRINPETAKSPKVQLILTFLNDIRNKRLPPAYVLSEILKTGGSGMLSLLADMAGQYEDQLRRMDPEFLLLMESDLTRLNERAKDYFERQTEEEQRRLLFLLIGSPVSKVTAYSMKKLTEIYEEKGKGIPGEFLLPMMGHSSKEVRGFISDKVSGVIQDLGRGNKELFLCYSKTLLYLPNKCSASKKNIYDVLPKFVERYRESQSEVEELLLDLGGSNIRVDSERALVALAKIKKGMVSF